MKFEPDQPFAKHRAMDSIYFEQNGHKFDAGYKHIGKVSAAAKIMSDPPREESEAIKNMTPRERAIAKMAQKKKGSLEGFKQKEVPDALESMFNENVAAKQAEELAE